MTPIHIPATQVGDAVQDTFLVLEVDTRTLDSGDPYTLLTLGNKSGELSTEPFWPTRQKEVAGIRKGHPVQVVGEIQLYRKRKQLKVTSIRVLPEDSVELSGLLPSVGPVDRYWETLDGWRREITKPRLKKVLELFFDDDEFRMAYERCPASTRGHHAQLGGLLKHTTEVAAIARAVARSCGADLDLVFAGVLLHDIGKLESYSWHGVFDFTTAGSLVGHVTLGALMLDRRLDEEEDLPCTEEERQVLLHMILSHHGRLEYGSPVTPMTLEAEVLHWADNASAKTASVGDALESDENFPDGPVSKPQWTLDHRRVCRTECDWGVKGSRS
jgi:3'-5' exoribonuclease